MDQATLCTKQKNKELEDKIKAILTAEALGKPVPDILALAKELLAKQKSA
ncbi:hypothetical protein [Ectobacillus antri]|nr:hypothetical protein [Ectobacillus antri]